MTHPSARIITLTPEYAHELLSRNPRNRNIRRANLETVKRAITNREWELNGEAIKIDIDGYMLDGQHRCQAVIETGISIKTFLIEGLPPETQVTMDTGKARSLADFLAMRGVKNAVRVAACASRIYVTQNHGIRQGARVSGSSSYATIRERLTWLDDNPWVEDVAAQANEVRTKAKFPGIAMVAALIYWFDQIDSEDSQYFWARLADGVNLPAGHPILVLLAALQRLSEEIKGARNEYYVAAITIKAWNAYREGREISMLKFRPGGANPESFPVAK